MKSTKAAKRDTYLLMPGLDWSGLDWPNLAWLVVTWTVCHWSRVNAFLYTCNF
ncbi:hypothetical protein IC229_19680 [Spirosoma sp. BT702]|uniref:Uncharacterized protein n=1 Tax=Spirosoma profusum TaxID=2771354 RepID=A0A926XY31_9BACT|nr:hypothetical protein [Spirosoma profusum]MBD2702877.1 hypothetical protein [Spirosoma profusum]